MKQNVYVYYMCVCVCVCVSHYSGELAKWIERKLEKVREMAVRQNDSEPDTDEEQSSEDDATDAETESEFLLVVLALQIVTINLSINHWKF